MKMILMLSVAAILAGGCAPDKSSVTYTIDDGNVLRPTVAVSSDGRMSAVGWMREDADGWNVYVSTFEIGEEPGAPVRVNHAAGNASPHDEAPAQVAFGPDGEIYVAWANRIDVEGRRFPASNLLFSRSIDGGKTFSTEKAVNSDYNEPPSSHTFHNMIVLRDGTIIVSWIDSRARDRHAREHGSSPSTGTPRATDAHAAMHGVGATKVADTPGPQIRIARSVDNGLSFRETAVVDDNSCPCCRTALTSGPGGEVYLGWRHVFENGDRDIVVARSDDGGRTFGPMVRVAEDGWNIDACPHAGPALAVGEDDRLHVAWFTGAQDQPALYHTRSDNRGESFTARTPIAQGVPMAYAEMSGGDNQQPRIVYHLPANHETVFATVQTSRLAGSSATVGGRASIASAKGFVVVANLQDDRILARIIRS
ncbi:MAG: sialidase family protein [Rhodothermales bacterium]|nr:sialidase family protein [Rhodothermales bacterium]